VTFDVRPPDDCRDCPRLAAYRDANRATWPDWVNAPVPAFGPDDARLLIVGLAPGLRGANRTGRPFTGDFAGDLLYATLLQFGFARGTYDRRPDDGLELVDCAIVNAVRCAPPQNKPTPQEIASCRRYLQPTLEAARQARIVLALGRIAHDSALRAMGQPLSRYPFRHGTIHALPDGRALADSYHCSRYNTNTGVLTTEMFEDVFKSLRLRLQSGPPARM